MLFLLGTYAITVKFDTLINQILTPTYNILKELEKNRNLIAVLITMMNSVS